MQKKNKFLKVKKNIFKNKIKKSDLIINNKFKKIDDEKSHLIPSFSHIFKKQKNIPQSHQPPTQPENNITPPPQHSSSTQSSNQNITQSSEESMRDQTHINSKNIQPTTKRKAVKGLRRDTPMKKERLNRGDKRLHPSNWPESNPKKLKKYNIIKNNSDYNLWRF